MKKSYTVFSAHHLPAVVSAKLADGTPVSTNVDSVVVQLSPADGQGGTFQAVFTGAESVAQADALFTPGAVINVAFTKGE